MARVEAGRRYDVDIVGGTGGLDAMFCGDYRRTRAVAMGLVECLCRELNSWRPRSGRGGERYKSEWGRETVGGPACTRAMIPLYPRSNVAGKSPVCCRDDEQLGFEAESRSCLSRKVVAMCNVVDGSAWHAPTTTRSRPCLACNPNPNLLSFPHP